MHITLFCLSLGFKQNFQFSIAAITNDYKFSSRMRHPCIISQFCRSESQWAWHNCVQHLEFHQAAVTGSARLFLSQAFGFTSNIMQVVGWVQFLMFIGLRSPFSCPLSDRMQSLLVDAVTLLLELSIKPLSRTAGQVSLLPVHLPSPFATPQASSQRKPSASKGSSD